MTSKTTSFERIVSSSHIIGIVGHFNPDGDSVGSVSGMLYYLRMLGKRAKVILPSDYPPFLAFLDKESSYMIFEKNKGEVIEYVSSCDTIICLDFNKLSRVEGLQDYIRKSTAKKILVDHHPFPEKECFDLVISQVDTSSACELLFWLLMDCRNIGGDVMKMPFDCVEALATGMLTDTNNFNNSVVSSTFEMASLLLKRGVRLDEINDKVFGSYSENRMRLMGTALSKDMTVIPELNAAYIILTAERQKEYDFQIGDSEGFVNLPLRIKGIGISALFVENKDFVRVSLRSDGIISVNSLSNLYFNGGGHDRAAGGRLFIPIEKVPEYFEKSLIEFLQKEKK